MPVGTQGTVKGIHQAELHDPIKAQIILGNTYHLVSKTRNRFDPKSGRIAQVYWVGEAYADR